jgi:hypothetical protein
MAHVEDRSWSSPRAIYSITEEREEEVEYARHGNSWGLSPRSTETLKRRPLPSRPAAQFTCYAIRGIRGCVPAIPANTPTLTPIM